MRQTRPSTESEKQTQTTVNTMELTLKVIGSWASAPFQRGLHINAKVQALSEEIKRDGGVVPGVITIGALQGQVYVVDGQHRLKAFELSGLDVGYADVRTHFFDSVGDMAMEFVRLNSSLVKLRPDDILRGLEASTVVLQQLRHRCPFIGYDMIRRNNRAPIVSMSMFLRCWNGSRREVPQTTGVSSIDAVRQLDEAEMSSAIGFASLCFEAWRRDAEYSRLWGALNLVLCAWLYRRIVLQHNVSIKATRYSKEDFRNGLMALSAEGMYLEYLVGRNITDRDRAPSYSRIKTIFQRRYLADTKNKAMLPQPAWAHTR